MKSISRFLKWCIISGLTMGTLYLGIVEKNQGALNVFKFLFWVMVFFNTIIAFSASRDKAWKKKMMEKKPPAVMLVIMGLWDVALACALAYLGWFWYAGFAVWQMLCEQGVYHEKEAEE